MTDQYGEQMATRRWKGTPEGRGRHTFLALVLGASLLVAATLGTAPRMHAQGMEPAVIGAVSGVPTASIVLTGTTAVYTPRVLVRRFNPTGSCDFNVKNTTSVAQGVTYGIGAPSKFMISIPAGQTRGLSIQMQGITYVFGLMSSGRARLWVACV